MGRTRESLRAKAVTPRRSVAAWRRDNIGRHLNHALSRFEARVLTLVQRMGYSKLRLAHVHLTRNLDLAGSRISDLAERAGMTKQSMSELVEQCAAAGLIERVTTEEDRRARIVQFTAEGLALLDAFRIAVKRAEAEMRSTIGPESFDVVRCALAAYGAKVRTLEL